jgi:hypothetical protein
MTNVPARQKDQNEPVRTHAPRRSIAAEHLLSDGSLCIMWMYHFGGIPAHG